MGGWRTAEEVAIYGAAARTVALIAVPLLIMNSIISPIIAEMYALERPKELEKLLRRIATIAGLPAMVTLAMFVLYGDFMLKLLFGGYYQAGYIVLVILSIGQLANVWAGSCGAVLMYTGNQLSMMYITIGCGLITLAGALFLVIPYAAIGVAIAAATGIILQNLIMLIMVKKKIGVWTHVSFSIANLTSKGKDH